MTELRRRVIIAGQFPPPMNGFAKITFEVAKALSEHHAVEIIELTPHTWRNRADYHLRRVGLAIRGVAQLLRQRRGDARVLYTACEGNLGMLYTIALTGAGRMLGYPIFIHHHSFGYIDAHFALMACLLRVSGRDTTHIFLCDKMARVCAARYRVPLKVVILSNAAFVGGPEQIDVRPEGPAPLTIGLLSNLSNQKGLDVFIDVLRQALVRRMNVAAVLAGPAVSAMDADVISAAEQEFEGKLIYRGAVAGEAKDDFYREIDVFLFPTRYVNEAQPVVVFEALAYGVPVLACDRGCINDQIGTHGAAVSRADDFARIAVEWLAAQQAAPEGLADLRRVAHATFDAERAVARRSIAAIFDGPRRDVVPAQQQGPA